ncbi:glycosyltransferase family 2 protein [Cyanobium sp. N.Huapi 1H5]|uniref:glycosyltransferase family 2 protein n=1 Tax=Cyanobium sp. N.Huapi 1H5 TaxID=2823719 RepID=UPI0020CD3948|nr:glycosyltransferase family 2 protein [Cyanobium sp. N.Huapi 1H5]MCP9836504.1 glycosyltransferase family 2 protein [Cyanobium sp. N.Huapi 1H5]
MNQTPLVTVGMPTYNRPQELERSLAMIRAQSYQNLDIVVSDNASPDPRVARLVLAKSEQDPRIRYFRQDSNIGPSANFVFVLRKAKGSFFMWAADDDEWHPLFIEKLLQALLGNSSCGLAFCDFDVRYPDGTACLSYGSFYQAYEDFLRDTGPDRVSTYALQAPERGKANLIYGLFRREALIDDSVDSYFHSKAWGADMLFVCDVLSRWSFSLVPDKLYSVGIPFPAPVPAVVDQTVPITHRPRRQWGLAMSHLQYFATYFRIMVRAPGSSPSLIVKFLYRLLPLSLRWLKQDLTVR